MQQLTLWSDVGVMVSSFYICVCVFGVKSFVACKSRITYSCRKLPFSSDHYSDFPSKVGTVRGVVGKTALRNLFEKQGYMNAVVYGRVPCLLG